MNVDKDHPHPGIEGIHNPLLSGSPLLLLPERLLVRWPKLVPVPSVGDEFTGTVVRVPPRLRDIVQVALFCGSHLARCDAAKRLSGSKEGRRVLFRIFDRSYAQKMLAAAKRIHPVVREHFKSQGESVALRRLFRAAYASAVEPPRRNSEE